MSEVLRGNRRLVTRRFWAVLIVTIFCGMSYMPMVNASPNREIQVDVSIGPNGVSDNYTILVPNNEIVTSLDFELFESPWPVNDVFTFKEEADWASGAVMDGVDYNLSGLRILPMSHEWDFEGGVQGWSLNSGGGGLMDMIQLWVQQTVYTLVTQQFTRIMAIIPIDVDDLLGNFSNRLTVLHVRVLGTSNFGNVWV